MRPSNDLQIHVIFTSSWINGDVYDECILFVRWESDPVVISKSKF